MNLFTNKKKKKGFTIVELVIVIAVIGVLAAILIPTFVGLVNRANVAADGTLVRELNNAIALDLAEKGETKHETMTDALEATKEYGFDVSRISTKASKNKILWDSVHGVFCYLKEDAPKVEYVPGSVEEGKELEAGDYRLWIISNAVDETYSTYLYKATETTFTTTKGLDVGNENVTSVTYNGGTNAQNVVIRTNSASTTLTINAASDTVNHYGSVGRVDAQKIDMNCYNEYGTAAYVKVTEGKVVAKAGGKIEVVFAANNDKDAVAVIKEPDGTIERGLTVIEPVSTTNEARTNGIPLEYSIDGETAASKTAEELATELTTRTEEVQEIAQEAINTAVENTEFVGVAVTKSGEETKLMTLEAFRNSVNAGNAYAGYTVKLLDNIDLENVDWTPIGTSEHPFSGVFDGQGYTIKNFKITGAGENVGLALFGCVKGTATTLTSTTNLSDFYNTTSYTVNLPAEEIFTCVVKNLNVSGADVNTTADGWTAAVVAYVENATISNIRLSNSVITASQKVGGIAGFLPSDYACYITNCDTSSNVTVTALTGNHSAGILGRVETDKSRGIIANCTNNATINCAGVNGGGIAGQAKNVLHYNNTNNGSVTGKTRAAGIATDCTGSVIFNCTNNGYIKTTAVYSGGSDSSAGIASYLASNGNSVIVNCHNSGTIEGNAPTDVARIAGIAGGGVDKGDKIINNSNTGTLINHAENGKVYDICNLSEVPNEVTPSDLSGLNEETAKANKYIKVNSSLVLSENNNTVTFNGQEKLEFVNSPAYLTLDLTGANKSSFVLVVNDTVVTLKNGGDNYVTISGKGNTVVVEAGQSIKSLRVSNEDAQVASSLDFAGTANTIYLNGVGLVNAEVKAGATVGRVCFGGTGTFTLTNRGTISHKTEGQYGAEHTIDTITASNITIYNYGTIEAKKNENDVASYALLFYNGATVKLYAYNGSNIIAEGNRSVIVTNGGTQVNVYYQDGAEVTYYGSQSTYPSAFGYYCTVTKMN